MQHHVKQVKTEIVQLLQDWGAEEVEATLTNLFEVIALSELPEPDFPLDKTKALRDIFALREAVRNDFNQLKL